VGRHNVTVIVARRWTEYSGEMTKAFPFVRFGQVLDRYMVRLNVEPLADSRINVR
jgi:hypothetical protein